MKTVLYLSRSRAIIVLLDARGWVINTVFDSAADPVVTLGTWLLSQRKRSIIVVLDVPGDTIDTLKLPSVVPWYRWYMILQLSRHFRQMHKLSNSLRSRNSEGEVSLRQYSIDSNFEQSAWFQALLTNRKKVRAFYSASLLAEKFMLPAELSTDILLCAGCGDDKIRHSYFKQKKLVFTRVLDKLQNRKQFLQQLSDTSQYLQEQRGRDQTSGENTKSLACCVTTDFPDPRGSTFSPRHVLYSIISRPNTSETHYVNDNLSDVGEQGTKLSVTQTKLFDFLADRLLSIRSAGTLSSYRLIWCSNGKQRKCITQICRDRLDYFLKHYAVMGIGILFSSISVLLLGIACSYAWQLLPLRIDVSAVQQQLRKTTQKLPATDVSPIAMRDIVLLYQSLPEEGVNPQKLLSDIASHIALSSHIMLRSIEWSADIKPDANTDDVSLELRNKLLLGEETNSKGRSMLLRLSGHVVIDKMSISEAYAVFHKFSQSLVSRTEWELIRMEQVPFDTANTAGVANETGALLKHEGQFSLLLRTTEFFGRADDV